MNKRHIRLALAGLAVVIAASALYLWSAARQKADVLAASVPERPLLDGWPPELQSRVQACEQRIASGGNSVAALGELSRLYHANGFYAEAAECYNGLEYLEPRDPGWPHRHAVLLAGFGDGKHALPLLEKVINLSPEYTPARLLQADLLVRENRIVEAQDAFNRILAQNPDEPYATLGLARCAFEAGNWQEARPLLESVVARTGNRLGYDLIVTVYEKLGLDARALAARSRDKASGAYRDPFDPWIDVLHEDSYDVYRLSLAAGSSLATGKPAEAIRRLERALGFSPDSVSLHIQLATTHLSEGALTKAREQFERCTALDQKFPDGWAHLSGLRERMGDASGAQRALSEGLRHNPQSPGLHLMNARNLKRAGARDEAIREFEVSIRLRPNEADAYIELASYYFETENMAKGVATMERALEAEPGHPAVLATLALEAIMSGDEAAAGKWMEQAVAQPRVGVDKLGSLKSAYRGKFGRAAPESGN